MQIVINISDYDYRQIKEYYEKNDTVEVTYGYIYHGTPLPKGHGRLGDLDKIKKEMQNYHDDCAKTSEYTRLGFETAMNVVEDTLTIIEADGGDENECHY